MRGVRGERGGERWEGRGVMRSDERREGMRDERG